ncbi:MAG: hypothetical protein FWC06_09185 [Treponema sp.]|nr:hypothetical protein [Treponema sp.]
MKTQLFIFLLVFVFVVTAYAQDNTNTGNYDFRNFKWGTPLSVVIDNEGAPNEKATDIFRGASTIPYIFYDINIIVDVLLFNNINVAGYECNMAMGFYQEKLFIGEYSFLSSEIESYQSIKNDLINKLTLLYGEPEIYVDESSILLTHKASWNNIYLYYHKWNMNVSNKEELILTYISYDYIIEQIRIVNDIRQNNNSGL